MKKGGVGARSSCIEVHVHLTCSMFMDQLLITEQQYRFWNSVHVVISEIITFCVITLCVRKVITICVERLLHSALKILLHFASILLHFALVLHFAAILITFCVNITFCDDHYILRRNTVSFWKWNMKTRRMDKQ